MSKNTKKSTINENLVSAICAAQSERRATKKSDVPAEYLDAVLSLRIAVTSSVIHANNADACAFQFTSALIPERWQKVWSILGLPEQALPQELLTTLTASRSGSLRKNRDTDRTEWLASSDTTFRKNIENYVVKCLDNMRYTPPAAVEALRFIRKVTKRWEESGICTAASFNTDVLTFKGRKGDSVADAIRIYEESACKPFDWSLVSERAAAVAEKATAAATAETATAETATAAAVA